MSNEPTDWWLVTLTLEAGASEIASAILFDCGSTGIVTLNESGDIITLGAYFGDRLAALVSLPCAIALSPTFQKKTGCKTGKQDLRHFTSAND